MKLTVHGMVVLLGLLFIVPARGTTATHRSVLPGDVILHAQCAPLKSSLPQFERFLAAATKDTGLPVNVSPGMILTMMPFLTGLPSKALDQTKGIHLLVCKGGQFALLLPLIDYDGEMKRMEAAQRVTPMGDGVAKLRTVLSLRPMFIASAGKNWLVCSMTEDQTRYVRPLARGWDLSPLTGRSALVVTADTGKLSALYQGELVATWSSFRARLERLLSDTAGQVVASKATPIMDGVFHIGMSALKQSQSVRMFFYPEATHLRVSAHVVPQRETTLQAFAKACHTPAPTWQQTALQAKDTALINGLHLSPKALASIAPALSRLVARCAAPADATRQKNMAELSSQLAQFMTGESTLLIGPDREGQPKSILLCQRYSPEKAFNLFTTIVQKSRLLLEKMLAEFPEPMPFHMALACTREAGAMNGVPYSRLALELRPSANSSPLLPMTWESLYAATDNTLLIVGGQNPEAALRSALQTIRRQPGTDETRDLSGEHLRAFQHKQIAFSTVRILDALRLLGELAAPMVPSTPKGQRDAVEDIVALLKKLPASSQPVSFALGIRQSGNMKGASPLYSLKGEWIIPSQALSESIGAIQTLLVRQKLEEAPVPSADTEQEEEF